MGLYVKLEADAGEFSAEMSASARALANLKVETERLKQGEKEIRTAIENTTKSYEYQGNRIKELKKELREKKTALDNAKKSYGENSAQVKNLQQAISDLNQAIKTNTKNYSENEKQIERLNNDLVDNLKGQTDVKNEVKYVNSVIAKQTQEYQKNAKQAENTASATGKLRDGFNMLRAIALGYAGKTLFEALIGGNAEFEQYMTSFDVMLGSAEKAESMISEIEQFAANTPLQMDGVAQATELLLSYGVAQEDVMTRLQQLGDVSKGNAEKMQRVSLAYGQMVAKGKVTGEELRQMTEAGVPLMNALAESMGVTTAQLSKLIEKGQVGIPQLNSALESMTSEGGQFFGMMEKQSQTMSGLWSTLMDNVKIFAREAGEESFEYLKAELSDLMNTLNQMAADGSLSAMAKDIGGSIATVVKVIVELVKIILSMKEAIITVTGAWVGFKSAILIENIVLGLTNGFKALITTLTATKSVMAGTKVANDALKTSMATTPWGAILSIISLVAGALISFTSTIDDTNQKVIEQGEAAAETSNKLLELSSRYEELSEKNQLSTDEAAEFESVEKDLISTLGSKASALEGLTKGTNEYAEALKNATEEELRNQQGMATAAKIAAGENVQKSGKYSNIAYTGSKEYNNLSSIIDPYLSDFKQESDGYGRYIGLKNADIQETTEYYYALKDAMAALNAEMSKTGNNSIAQSNLYKAINQEIQSLSGSVDTYVQQLTNEETIKTRLRLGNPETLDEYNELKKAVFEATGAHESFKDTIYSVVDSAFPQFSGKAKEAEDSINNLFGATVDFDTALQNMQNTYSLLSSAQDEYNTSGEISIGTLQKVIEKYGDLEQPVAEYLAGLRSAGDILDILKGKYAEDEQEYQRNVLNKAIMSNEFCDDVGDMNSQLYEQLSIMAGEDAGLFANYCQAKVVATSVAVKAIGTQWSQMFSTLAQAMSAITGGLDAGGGYTRGEAARKRAYYIETGNTAGVAEMDSILSNITAADNYLRAADKLKNVNWNFSGTNFDFGSYGGGSSKGGSGGSSGRGGSGGSGSSGSSSQREEKDTRLDNWKKERDEIEKEDKAWNEDQKKRELISENDYLYNLGERARRYKEYAAWVLNLDFGTEEERQNIHEEYLEAAREEDLDYLDFYLNMCDEEAKAKQELGGAGDFEDAIKEIEKGKALIQQYYEQGKLSAQEYEQSLENVEKKIKSVQKAAYEARYDNSMKWIDDRNFYNDWKRGDNEIEAIRRVIEYTDEAKEAGILTWTEWCDKIDELEKKLYTAQKEIYEKMLQESYDTEKKAVEDKLELRKEELEAEKRMVQERADAEIKAIDDVLQKRKEQKEDSDDNLKLEQLKNRLEYENDEDNRRALQKEIDQLESDIEDKMFEREMSAKKEQIKAEEESKIEAIENTIAHETELAENQIDYLTKMFELKMENINVATILHQSMNIDDYVNVGKEMGSGIAEGVRIAFKDGISELVKNVVTNATANIRAVAPANNIVNNNSNVNNTKSYTINQNISGNNAASPANVSAYYRRALKTAELEVM